MPVRLSLLAPRAAARLTHHRMPAVLVDRLGDAPAPQAAVGEDHACLGQTLEEASAQRDPTARSPPRPPAVPSPEAFDAPTRAR